MHDKEKKYTYTIEDKEIIEKNYDTDGKVIACNKINDILFDFFTYEKKSGNGIRLFVHYSLRDFNFSKISRIEPYNDCTLEKKIILEKAKKKAQILAKYAEERAENYLVNIVTYKKWFGEGGDKNKISNSYNKISNALKTKEITFDCKCRALNGNGLAYTYDNAPYYINICDQFWTKAVNDHGFDSRAGTIIHEMSHFIRPYGVGAEDKNNTYGVGECKALAKKSPADARNNADNIAFFAEDTMSYFTIKTEVEKTETVEPMMRTGGRKSNLKTITTKETKQVVGIDPIVGEIINVPFVEEISGKKTSEKYELDLLSCMYRVKLEQEELPYNKLSFTYLNDFSPSNEFTENTVLDLQISAIKDKVIPVRWETLKKSGQFSDMSHWIQKKTQIEKETETKGIFKLNPEAKARLAEQKMISDLVIAFGKDTEDTGCLLQREYYDVLENGANITHPKISYSYKVNITQSTESDINDTKIIIKRMENFSGRYTEEKQIYDILNNPLYAPKIVEKEKTFSSGKKTNGILDTLLPDVNPDISDEMTIDNLQMFTN